jgi:hypothetical protein
MIKKEKKATATAKSGKIGFLQKLTQSLFSKMSIICAKPTRRNFLLFIWLVTVDSDRPGQF